MTEPSAAAAQRPVTANGSQPPITPTKKSATAAYSGAAHAPTAFYLTVNGSIDSVSYPGAENLYCKFSLVTGQDWLILDGIEHGITQIANSRSALGSFVNGMLKRPEELTLNYPLELTYRSTNVSGWPQLVCSVYTINKYGQLDSIRGYCSVRLPTSNGRHTRVGRLYAPLSSSLFQRFTSYLSNRAPEFYDPTFVAQGRGREVTRVMAAGTVKITVNVMSRYMHELGYNVIGERLASHDPYMQSLQLTDEQVQALALKKATMYSRPYENSGWNVKASEVERQRLAEQHRLQAGQQPSQAANVVNLHPTAQQQQQHWTHQQILQHQQMMAANAITNAVNANAAQQPPMQMRIDANTLQQTQMPMQQLQQQQQLQSPVNAQSQQPPPGTTMSTISSFFKSFGGRTTTPQQALQPIQLPQHQPSVSPTDNTQQALLSPQPSLSPSPQPTYQQQTAPVDGSVNYATTMSNFPVLRGNAPPADNAQMLQPAVQMQPVNDTASQQPASTSSAADIAGGFLQRRMQAQQQISQQQQQQAPAAGSTAIAATNPAPRSTFESLLNQQRAGNRPKLQPLPQMNNTQQ